GRHVREVIPRRHQDVRRRLWVDVTEGDSPLPVQHYRGRDLSGRDPAEQAVWHSTIIVAAGHAWCPTAGRPDGQQRPVRHTSHCRPKGKWRKCANRTYRLMFWPIIRNLPGRNHLPIGNKHLRVIRDRSVIRKHCLVSAITVILASPQSSGGYWGGVTECGLGSSMQLRYVFSRRAPWLRIEPGVGGKPAHTVVDSQAMDVVLDGSDTGQEPASASAPVGFLSAPPGDPVADAFTGGGAGGAEAPEDPGDVNGTAILAGTAGLDTPPGSGNGSSGNGAVNLPADG